MTSESVRHTGDGGSPAGTPKVQYRQKTSFYQERAAADRMRAAFLNTAPYTGFSSLSEFINAAVNEKVMSLEQAHNHGQSWSPLGAREIPQGKPAGPRPRLHETLAAKERLREHGRLALWDFVEKVRAGLEPEYSGGRGAVNVFYSADSLQALIETYDASAGVSAFRQYDAEASFGEFWLHTSSGQSWDEGGSLPAGQLRVGVEDLPGNGRRQVPGTPAPELVDVVEKARDELEQRFSLGRGNVTVFYSPDGLQSLTEVYDIGYEISNFTCYNYDPAARLISVRSSVGHSWEDGGTTPYSE